LRRAHVVQRWLQLEKFTCNTAYASLPLVAGAVRNAVARRAKTSALRRSHVVQRRLRSEQPTCISAYASPPLVAGAVRNAMARHAKPVPCGSDRSPHSMQRTHHRHSWQVQYAMQWHGVKNQCLTARTSSAAPAAIRTAHMQCSVRTTATRGRCSTQCSGTAAFRRAQAVRRRLRSEQLAACIQCSVRITATRGRCST